MDGNQGGTPGQGKSLLASEGWHRRLAAIGQQKHSLFSSGTGNGGEGSIMASMVNGLVGVAAIVDGGKSSGSSVRVTIPLKIGIGCGSASVTKGDVTLQLAGLQYGASVTDSSISGLRTAYFDRVSVRKKRRHGLLQQWEMAFHVANAAGVLLCSQAFFPIITGAALLCLSAANIGRWVTKYFFPRGSGIKETLSFLAPLRGQLLPWELLQRFKEFSHASAFLLIMETMIKWRMPKLHASIQLPFSVVLSSRESRQRHFYQSDRETREPQQSDENRSQANTRRFERGVTTQFLTIFKQFFNSLYGTAATNRSADSEVSSLPVLESQPVERRSRNRICWRTATELVIQADNLVAGTGVTQPGGLEEDLDWSLGTSIRSYSEPSEDSGSERPSRSLDSTETVPTVAVEEVEREEGVSGVDAEGEEGGLGSRNGGDYLMGLGEIHSGWKGFQQKISLFLRACFLAFVFFPLIVFGPLIYWLSTVMGRTLESKLRSTLWWLLRFSLEQCGAAFIKWGQWSATREDLFSEDMCIYLGRLHDQAPRHSYSYTRKAIQESFGRTVEDLFVEFDATPAASGSVAQIHRANLREVGEGLPSQVAVKVRHPDVALRIFQDFQIMGAIADLAQRLPSFRWLNLRQSVDQFSHTMTAQADLRVDAHNLARFQRNFEGLKETVVFPQLVPHLVSEGVIVESFEAGAPLHQFLRTRTTLNTQTDHLLKFSWDQPQRCRNPSSLREDMKALFERDCRLHERPIDLNAVLKDVLRLCRKHEVTVDSAFASLLVAVCVIVGFANSLDPDLSILDVAIPCLFMYNLTGEIIGRIYG